MEAFELQSALDSGFIWKFFSAFRTILPGRILSFNSSNNTASITVSIQEQDAAGDPVTGVITLYNVPCLMSGGASNYATFELSEGDQGMLLVCDRDLDNFKASQGANGVCNTACIGSLKDAIFIPGLFLPQSNGVSISSTTQINAKVGSTTFIMTPASITMNCAGAEIIMQNGNIVLNGNVIINNAVTIGQDGNVSGNLTIDGGITTTQNIQSNSDVKAGSISLSGHVHGGVETGGGETSGPQ